MRPNPTEPIAVVGLSGIFPGSRTVPEFFRNVLRKRCFVRDLPDWLWEREIFFAEDPAEPLKSYTQIGALLGDLEADLMPFRIPPAVADQMSLNQKLALICAQEALADAGYLGREFDRERVGVILAAVSGESLETHVETLHARRFRSRLDQLALEPEQKDLLTSLWEAYEASYPSPPITEDSLPGGIGSLVAGRIASAFDLHGMHLTIDAACASSLAAVTMAMTTLRAGICDMVITGGVDTDVSLGSFVTFSKVNTLSATGSYPFDKRADGFVIGEGCGLLVLKRLSDAIRDGDRIYATLRGFGSSSDGAGKGITAPSSDGQLRALRRAYLEPGISPADIHFLECHGTGTVVGDAEELTSVDRLLHDMRLGPIRRTPLAIGSVKAMLGHLKVAAGVAGLFRAILAVNSRVIPPQINFESPNTDGDWDRGLIRIPKRAAPITGREIYAGVSSFGFGGTNFHVVLSSPPVNAREALVPVQKFLFPDLPTLRNDVAFLFPGQGSQYVGMLEGIRGDPDAEALFDRAEKIVTAIAGRSMLDCIYPPAMVEEDEWQVEAQEAALRATIIAQPAIFTLSAILLEKVRKAGIECGIAIGHSLGEYTALYAAGVLSFEDAVRVVTLRGQLMESTPSAEAGTMAFVSCASEQVDELLREIQGYVVCANVNSYEQTVISGETEAVRALVELAMDRGLKASLLNVDCAFHSRFMTPTVAPMKAILRDLAFRNTSLPVPANRSRQMYPFQTEADAAGRKMGKADHNRVVKLLVEQIDHPVDFIAQIELAYEAGVRRFVEIGPKNVLSNLVDTMLQGKPFQVIGLDLPQEKLWEKPGALRERLAEPLRVHRRPLPTKPRGIRSKLRETSIPTEEMSVADRVRSVVSQVSGYGMAQIEDDHEFERDLGIDTLKILQIVLRLRGSVLPKDFTQFRQATSVRKILNASQAAGLESSVAVSQDAAPRREPSVHCYRYQTLEKALHDEAQPAKPAASLRLVVEPSLASRKELLARCSELVEETSQDALLIWGLPDSAETLCEKTIPDLIRQVVELADRAMHAEEIPSVHIVTLASPDDSNQASYRALCALVKSFQKDLTYLRFSYCHLDTGQPDVDLLRQVLANPVLGRRVCTEDQVEVGQLEFIPQVNGNMDELVHLLGPEDVVLVTGGARGIAASIVQELIPRVQARFLLIGRKPHLEDWISEKGQGRVQYLVADLCDPEAVRALGLPGRDITLVVHAAGVVISRPIRQIKSSELEQTLGVKIQGLERVLEGLDVSRLRGVVNFSSAAGYFGGDGHPDYAAANGYLDGFHYNSLPILSIGWSAWDEVGMASSTATKQFLDLAGVELIPLQQGIRVFGALLASFLKSETTDTQNVLVRAGMAPTCFLPSDPFRTAMIAGPGESDSPESSFHVTELSPGLPGILADPPLSAALAEILIAPPKDLRLDDTGVVALNLEAAGRLGEAYQEILYTQAEREEIGLVKAEKRRLEKLAGKLAVKILVEEVLRRWFGDYIQPNAIEVLTSGTPVDVSIPSKPQLDAKLRAAYFSISHSEDIVCAAVSRRPTGIDVERVQALPAVAIEEIYGPHLLGELNQDKETARRDDGGDLAPEVLPITVFTQKEAVLKAAGTGMAQGLRDVDIHAISLGTPTTAAYQGHSYQVLSLLDRGFVFSLARVITASPERLLLTTTTRKVVTASYGQEGLWFLEKLEGIGSANHVAWVDRMRGPLNTQALTQSLQHIVDRHEALRTVLRDSDDRCQAEVLSDLNVSLPMVDLNQLPPEEAGAELERRCVHEMQRRFDLARGPLLRGVLFHLGSDEHALLLVFHHAVMDASSALALRRELRYCYEAYSARQEPQLPPLPFQYGDYSRRQRETLKADRLEHLVRYWEEKLKGYLPFLNLPTDRRRPARQTYRGGNVTVDIPQELLQALRELSQECGVTPFVTFLTAFQTLLMRMSGETDIIVGAPFVGRENLETFPLIGYFVNMLPLRTDLSGNPRFRDLLPEARTTVLEALGHEDLPFQKLVEHLSPQRNAAYPPIFQVIIRFLQEEPEGVTLPSLEHEFTEVPNSDTSYDLSLIVGLGAKGGETRFEYNRDLFTEKTVRMIANRFLRLLEAITGDSDVCVADIPLMTVEEEQQVLKIWNDTQRAIPERGVHDLFAEQAERTPDATALVCHQDQLTYQELNLRANQLGHYLQRLGVGPETLVGVAMERSLEMVIAILAILKAGGAYLPLDPAYPAERLGFMLKDGDVQVMITQDSLEHLLGPRIKTTITLNRDWEIIARESTLNPESKVGLDQLAYVMYTSGSTGQPKGVEVCHRGIVRLVFGGDYVHLGSDQIMLHMAPISFDASTFELWGTLLHGGRCVLFPDRIPSMEKLGSLLQEQEVNTLWLTASLFNAVIEEAPEILTGVRYLVIGGEALSVDHVHRALAVLPETQIINGYGPTEATTFTCCYPIPPWIDADIRTIPIGRPLDNTTVYVLDERGRPVPVGLPGELYIGGMGVARGYMNRPEITHDKFVPDPFSQESHARLYKTGDIVRYLPDGNLEFLGRLDDQVKIRGFRIEPGEIEVDLRQHTDVREAVVLVKENQPGDRRLVAYAQPQRGKSPIPAQLRQSLQRTLPAYMLPDSIVILETFPLTPVGKIDRMALHALDVSLQAQESYNLGPRDHLEAKLANVWESTLGVTSIGIFDNFFDRGGHSLAAIRLVTRIQKELGYQLPLEAVFQAPTVAQQASFLRSEFIERDWSCLVPVNTDGSKPAFFCVSPSVIDVITYRNLAQYLGDDQPFYALYPRARALESKSAVADDDPAERFIHEIQRLQPHGPYLLGGYSSGGTTALEVARRLRTQGEDVALAVLIDTFGPNYPVRLPWVSPRIFNLLRVLRRVESAVWKLWTLDWRGKADFLRLEQQPFFSTVRSWLERRFGELSWPAPGLDLNGLISPLGGKHYPPQRYDGGVVLLRAQKGLLGVRKDPSLGWAGWIENLQIFVVPGNHESLLFQRRAKHVADILQAALDAAGQ